MDIRAQLYSLFFLVQCFSLFGQNEPMYMEGEAQGTSYHIRYYDSLQRDFYSEIEDLLKSFDHSLSTYDPNSLISRVNRNEQTHDLDAYFQFCFAQAKEVWRETDGAFDPTVYPLVNAWGFGPEQGVKPTQHNIDSLLQFVGFQMITMEGDSIVKKDPRISLDFNAFAQGYSVDVVADFLDRKGCLSYLVEIGGEVFAKGMRLDGEDWLVGLEKPEESGNANNPLQLIIRLENKAIATSGNYRKFTIMEGKKYAHQMDPKTGFPTNNTLLSVTVIADDCITADAYATALSVMGLEKAQAYLASHREIEAYLIASNEDGSYKIVQSALFDAYVADYGE